MAPSEPNSSARTRATRPSSPSAASPSAKVRAARIGPTVCEVDGPMPIEKRSKTLIATRVIMRRPVASDRWCDLPDPTTSPPCRPWSGSRPAYHRHPDAVEAGEDDLRDALFGTEPKVFAHVAEQDGDVVGAAIWFVNFSTWTGRHGIYLEDLVVRPAARRGGHGRALMGELRRIAAERGYRRLDWQVMEWNEDAQRFYRSLGAAPVGETVSWRLPL